MKSKQTGRNEDQSWFEAVPPNLAEPNLGDPHVVLSLLEADQVVAAKRQSHFGPRKFSFGVRVLLWGLRIYVVLMMVIVLVSVYQAFHPSP